ncbi:MAG: bifunctional folylpolyglutamate synthase/dihydrofolate synthase [Firmicutes bacterium]|nr:bifunctional folylpolyglutamate synthase/dihydrofolate synthase [Bacillota bacterium]
MIYQEFIAWLEEVPLYGHKDGTNNIRKLMHRLGDPQKHFRTIHVAGTNGKGSCCAMLQGILQSAGYKTGLFTSPHLVSYTERIRVDKQEISEEDFVRIGLVVKSEIEAMVRDGENHCTFFEILTAMGFLFFAEQNIDICVLETGVGGRLDATNIVEPPELILTLITSISLDHTKVLGDTLTAIAGEKAGILRPGIPVVLAQNPGEVRETVKSMAQSIGAPFYGTEEKDLVMLDNERKRQNLPALKTPLAGDYQKQNLAAVLCCIRLLRETLEIPDEALLIGLEETRWPGRMDFRLWHGRTLLLDGAHNPGGAMMLRRFLENNCPDSSCVLLFSALGKKDVTGILRELGECRAIRQAVITAIHGEDNLDWFAEIWNQTCPDKPCAQVPQLEDAMALACRLADGQGENEQKPGLVVCAGSLYLIGDILKVLDGGRSNKNV